MPAPMSTEPSHPLAADLCADDAISVENIQALVRAPVIGP